MSNYDYLLNGHGLKSDQLPPETVRRETLRKRCDEDIATLIKNRPDIFIHNVRNGAEGEVIISVCYEGKRRHFWALSIQTAHRLAYEYLESQGWKGAL